MHYTDNSTALETSVSTVGADLLTHLSLLSGSKHFMHEQWSPTEPLFHKNKVITSVKHSRMRQKISHPKHLGMDDFDRKVSSGGQCQGDPNVQPAILVLTGEQLQSRDVNTES